MAIHDTTADVNDVGVHTCLMQYVTARTAHDIIPNLQFVKTLMSKFFPIRGYNSMPYQINNHKIYSSQSQQYFRHQGQKCKVCSPNRSRILCFLMNPNQWKKVPHDPVFKSFNIVKSIDHNVV